MVVQKLLQLKEICSQISPNGPEDKFKEDIRCIQELIRSLPPFIVQKIQPIIITAFWPYMGPNNTNTNNKVTQSIVDTLSALFDQSKIEETQIFFNLYGYLLFQIYDNNNPNLVKEIYEEFKLSIIICLKSLFKSISWEIFPSIYSKDKTSKFGMIINVCLKLAKNEKFRALRIASLELLMIIAYVDDKSDRNDREVLSVCSNIFMFFIPGLSSGLVNICLENEKCGHKIISTALKTLGRLLCLVMQDYGEHELMEESINKEVFTTTKFENEKDISDYLNKKRTPNWYKEHDKKLQVYFLNLKILSSNQHPKVRYELALVCEEILQFCMETLPMTVGVAVETLIALSQDEFEEISEKSKFNLKILSKKFYDDNESIVHISNYLESNFEANIDKIPRIFNGIDEGEQLVSLNLLIGYLQLFGEHKLKQLLFTPSNLNKLILSLLHVAQLEVSGITLIEEYALQEIDVTPDLRTPWKVFRFQDKKIEKSLTIVCQLLAMPGVVEIVLDYLVEMFINNIEEKKEVTLILNEILSAKSEHSYKRVKEFLKIYLDPDHCKLPLQTSKTVSLGAVQNNLIQLCLQIEGIGKMALSLGGRFQEFLLKVLYFVLEKAGSGNALIAASGISSITNIAVACGYTSVKELINKNSDYFSFHVICKLKNPDNNESVFHVLSAVMKFCDLTVLPSMLEIVDSVLIESCNKYQEKNTYEYLRVFAIFIKCLHKWLGIKIKIPDIKSREEKDKEVEDFKISNLEKPIEDFSDENVMGKSVEEMYEEDLKCSELEEETYPTVEEYKKPEPPDTIKITVSILNCALNFLPSKNPACKILVLEILNSGLEIISDWEDELLPIVHKIWSPLVNRFKEFETPLIINLSFELLVKLACLSKEFIRSRTVKEVLPSLVQILSKQAKESFLKDVGSSYRYTQGYKMQLAILPKLGRLFYDLDVGKSNIGLFVEAVEPYLSCKQPKILQEAALNFYKILKLFDEILALEQIKQLVVRKYNNSEFVKSINLIKEGTIYG